MCSATGACGGALTALTVCVFQFLFQQLGVIIAIVKHHIKNYLEDIFALIKVSPLSSYLLNLLSSWP